MIAGIDGDVLRYELGHVAMSKEHIFDIQVEKPWPEEEVHKLVDDKVEQIIKRVNADECEIYLTGQGNFRLELAKIKQYKGTRIGLEKPHHWETVSARLKDKWGAITFHGIEADDWLGIRGTEEGDNFTACSRDKDIRQVPGCYHYSWPCGDSQPELGPFQVDGLGTVSASWRMYGVKKPQKSWKLEGNGTAFLYGQLLVGDSVDNIPGLPGTGPKTAADLLGELSTERDLFAASSHLKNSNLKTTTTNGVSYESLVSFPVHAYNIWGIQSTPRGSHPPRSYNTRGDPINPKHIANGDPINPKYTTPRRSHQSRGDTINHKHTANGDPINPNI